MGIYPGRKYVILPLNEVDTINFNEVLEDSNQTLRYSTDNEYTFVKFEGDTPSFLDGKTQHTYTEIKEILDDVNGIWYTSYE